MIIFYGLLLFLFIHIATQYARSKSIGFNNTRKDLDNIYYGIVRESRISSLSINHRICRGYQLVVCNYGLGLKRHWFNGGGYHILDFKNIKDPITTKDFILGDETYLIKFDYLGSTICLLDDAAEVWHNEYDIRLKANQALHQSP